MFRYDRRCGYYNLSNYKNTKNLSGLFEYDFSNFNLQHMSLTSFFSILGQWAFQQILDLYEINGVQQVILSSVKSDKKIELSPFLSTMNRIKQGTGRGTEPQMERSTELRTERATEWGSRVEMCGNGAGNEAGNGAWNGQGNGAGDGAGDNTSKGAGS